MNILVMRFHKNVFGMHSNYYSLVITDNLLKVKLLLWIIYTRVTVCEYILEIIFFKKKSFKNIYFYIYK